MIHLTKLKFILLLAVAALLGGLGSQVPSLFHKDTDRPACVPQQGIDFLKPGEINSTGAEKTYGPSSKEAK